MTPHDEKYVHLDECRKSLSHAWLILQELRDVVRNSYVHDAAFRFALVTYAKSYTRSDGIHKYGRDPYRLDLPPLSPEDLDLHVQILNLRHEVLAHSDLRIKDSIVSHGRIGGSANICIGQNIPEPLPSCEAVINLIEHTLHHLDADMVALRESLVPLS